jgi:beta-N-acetylhexosaminidase
VKYSIFFLIIATAISISANRNLPFNLSRPLDRQEDMWVDSMYNSLTETEKIAQLMMVRASDERNPVYEQQVESVVRQYKVGGICLFQGSPEMLADLTNRCQAACEKLPLMVSIDAEWGLGMRLKETTVAYPKQLMLGAIQNNQLIYEYGKEVGRQCKRMGIHINFAPDADINNNGENPVINDRSFGEDRNNVAAKCFQYMMGMQDVGVMACAKHFPGHGDTKTDSHFDLPQIPHNRARLDSLELFPFRVMSQYGIGSFMVAHLNVPALDNRENRPTTLSRPVIHDLLREKIGFNGLIFTDAMEMKGVTKYFGPGQADVEALRAGNDIVLLPADIGAAIQAVQVALTDGTYDRAEFEKSVKRVLRAKYRLGLVRPQHIDLNNLRKDLNNPEAWMMKRRLIENAVTLVRDRSDLVGFETPEKYRFATLALGDTNRTIFQTNCGFYAPMTHLNAPKDLDSAAQLRLMDTLSKFDVVLMSLHNMRSKAVDNFGLTESEILLIRELSKRQQLVLTVFGNPYSLKYFNAVPALIEAYNEDPITQQVAAQALFGAIDFKGKLPVSASLSAFYKQGIETHFTEKRLAYDRPESVGMSSDSLAQMDSLVQQMIKNGAAPGCQILVARNNKIVWQKAYGYQTYEQTTPVTIDNLYDIASVTKIAATTITTMQLVDQGKINLDSCMSRYVPELRKTNKKDLTVREILAHHAGLQPWIPFYQRTLENGLPDAHIYHREKDEDSEIPVAPGMYMDNAWVDTIWNTIFRSDLRADKKYKYSDLGLYLTARAIENVSGSKLDLLAREQFYKPLGLSATFTPWKYGLTARCVPTEEDRYFRQQRLQGYVHDMGAAMLGGVSGHAGVFSSANDLAKIFQMLLNGGSYFGKQYIRPETVNEWTIRFPGSTRRGIGFDMKELDPKETQNMSDLAGPNTFGHTGFTGICAWADPDQNLIFIFCSNRTYPTMENNKLISGNYRPKLQSIVYKSIMK